MFCKPELSAHIWRRFLKSECMSLIASFKQYLSLMIFLSFLDRSNDDDDDDNYPCWLARWLARSSSAGFTQQNLPRTSSFDAHALLQRSDHYSITTKAIGH